jgi:hypothetical protein
MTALPMNTALALAPPTQATKYAEITGEGDAVFSAKPTAAGGPFSWAGQGSSLQGNLTLAGNPIPEENKILLTHFPQPPGA